MRRCLKVVITTGLVVCLSVFRAAADEQTIGTSRRVFEFPSSGVTFNADFEGARLNEVAEDRDGTFRIVIRPENEPINDSVWYAFRVSANPPQKITIQVNYEGGKHRYPPKVSRDGTTWQRLSVDSFDCGEAWGTLRVDAGPKPVWISAQEMIGVVELYAWMDKLADLPFVDDSVIGRSVGGRSIRQLTIGTGEPKYVIAIVGRQHPPAAT